MNHPKFFGLLALAVLAALLTACRSDPSILEAAPALASVEKGAAAQSQIPYVDVAGSKISGRQDTPVIKVMDAVGKHQTVI